MTRVLVISHEPQAHPAIVGEILRDRGVDMVSHTVLADPAAPDVAFPDLSGVDAVIAFGSFANAYDERHRPWVQEEIALLNEVIAADLPYLGVCFGGQLLAESLGGRVERAPDGLAEIGLVTFAVEPGIPLPAGPWFTWHEDRIVLPDDPRIQVLARNENAVQLFRRGRAVGTQFHPEADVPLIAEWARIGPDHIPQSTSEERLLGELAAASAQTRVNCSRLLDWFLADVARIHA